jgi:hypothetical protein
MDAHPLLPENHRALGIQLDNDGEDQHGNRQNHQCKKGQNKIYQSLEKKAVHHTFLPEYYNNPF